MRNRQRVILGFGLALLLIVIIVLLSLLVLRAPTRPKPDISNIRQVCQEQSERGLFKQSLTPPALVYSPYKDLMYKENQIIISGPPAEVNKVTATLELSLIPATLNQMGSTGLNLNKQNPVQEPVGQDLARQDLNQDLTIKLYQIGDDERVEQVGCEINKLSEELGFEVFADPNYYTSPAGGWTGGGSPWTQNGGGWVEGIPGGGLITATNKTFPIQWALDQSGIELFDSNGGRSVAHTGAGVRIGIFDTSPFTEVNDGEMREYSWRELMGDTPVGLFEDPALTLKVWHPSKPPDTPNCPGLDRHTEGKSLEDQDLSSHGLFVAGLAHTVAPSSEIYLIRVLGKDACGDLAGINEAIAMFIDQTMQEKDTLEDTIINLSLGVHEPPDPVSFGLPDQVESLRFILQEAVDKGAVVVAAAGNDSYYIPPTLLPNTMETPAAYPFVIGVAASNIRGGRGCFSNIGDVAAPGGDGQRSSCQNPACDPGDSACRDADCSQICTIPDCASNGDACLTSLVRNSKTGQYIRAHWVGTSFATPLVSGLAALLLEAGESPADVRRIIGNSAVKTSAYEVSLGDGVINIQNSLP